MSDTMSTQTGTIAAASKGALKRRGLFAAGAALLGAAVAKMAGPEKVEAGHDAAQPYNPANSTHLGQDNSLSTNVITRITSFQNNNGTTLQVRNINTGGGTNGLFAFSSGPAGSPGAIFALSGPAVAIQASSDSGNGVAARSGSSEAVNARSTSGIAVRAFSGNDAGTASSAAGVNTAGNPGIFALGLAGGLAGQFQGDVLITGNFTANGLKSAAVEFPDGSHRRLYCVESPESYFEDVGQADLAGGEAVVQLDGDFRSVVRARDEYLVFLTEYGDYSQLYVAERRPNAFVVRSKNGRGNGKFGYRVLAKRADVNAPRFEKVNDAHQKALGKAKRRGRNGTAERGVAGASSVVEGTAEGPSAWPAQLPAPLDPPKR